MAKKLAPEAVIGLSIVGIGLVIFAILEWIVPKPPAPGGGAGMPSPTKNVTTPQPQPPPPFVTPQPPAGNSNTSIPDSSSAGNFYQQATDAANNGYVLDYDPNAPSPVLNNFETIDQQYIDTQNGHRRR